MDVYVASNAGIPDEELLAEIESYLQEKREISVDLQVLPPTALPVDVAVAHPKRRRLLLLRSPGSGGSGHPGSLYWSASGAGDDNGPAGEPALQPG